MEDDQQTKKHKKNVNSPRYHWIENIFGVKKVGNFYFPFFKYKKCPEGVALGFFCKEF
jgi:hypothetical protein